MVASGMEDGEYSKSIRTLKVAYTEVDSVEAWRELEAIRETTIGSLERRRRSIVITSLMVWLAVGGLLLFLWLRVVSWDRIERSLAGPRPSVG